MRVGLRKDMKAASRVLTMLKFLSWVVIRPMFNLQ